MDNQNNNKNPKNNRQGWGVILATTLLAIFVVMGLSSLMRGQDPEEISYDKFLNLVEDKKVEKVTLDTAKIYITLTDEARKKELEKAGNEEELAANELLSQMEEAMGQSKDKKAEHAPDYYTGAVDDYQLAERLDKAGVTFEQAIPDTMSAMIFEVFITLILPLLLMVILFNFVMRKMSKGGGMMGIGKSNAKVYVEKETGVNFSGCGRSG